jgi:hypothetical protein
LSVSVAKLTSIGLIYIRAHRIFCGFYGDCERYNESDDEPPTRKEIAFFYSAVVNAAFFSAIAVKLERQVAKGHRVLKI